MESKRLYKKYIDKVESIEDSDFALISKDLLKGHNAYLRMKMQGSSVFNASWTSSGGISTGAPIDNDIGFLPLFVNRVAAVEEILYTKHISVVGKCHTTHFVADGLFHHFLDRSLTVKQRILGVNV